MLRIQKFKLELVSSYEISEFVLVYDRPNDLEISNHLIKDISMLNFVEQLI